MSTGWRVWIAFDRLGANATQYDRSEHWRCLADSCRGSDGKIDRIEFSRWLDLMIDHSHLWADA